jgi:hypothetical protein
MSKFLLNLLVQISKALVYSKIQFLIQKFFFLISARPPPLFFFQPSHGPPPPSRSSPVRQNWSVFKTCPFSLLVRFRYLSVFSTSKLVRFSLKTCPIRSLRPQAATCGSTHLAHSAQATLAHLPKGVFSSTLRTLAETPSLSHVTAMWGPLVSSIPFLPRRPTVATRRLRPPRAARPPTLRCLARSSLHALISLLISLLNPSSSHPTINGIKAITAGRFPLPRPGVPLPGHYKRTRSTPGHQHTHLALNRLLPSLQRPLHRAPPPPIVLHRRPIVSDPPPRPLAAGEAHLHPLSILSSTAVRFRARERRSGRSPVSLFPGR